MRRGNKNLTQSRKECYLWIVLLASLRMCSGQAMALPFSLLHSLFSIHLSAIAFALPYCASYHSMAS